MPYKPFFKKAGYAETVELFLEQKPFIKGISGDDKSQMLELLCQLELCRINYGFGKLCEMNHCMGVPVCSKSEYKAI